MFTPTQHKRQREKLANWTSSKLKLPGTKARKKVKNQTWEWETIFANCISDKNLVSEYVRVLQCKNNHKNNKYLKGKFGAIMTTTLLATNSFCTSISLSTLCLRRFYLCRSSIHWQITDLFWPIGCVGKRSTDWRREKPGYFFLAPPLL